MKTSRRKSKEATVTVPAPGVAAALVAAVAVMADGVPGTAPSP